MALVKYEHEVDTGDLVPCEDGFWLKAADVEAVLKETVKVIDLLHQGYRCEDEVDHRVCERAQRLLDVLRGQS